MGALYVCINVEISCGEIPQLFVAAMAQSKTHKDTDSFCHGMMSG
jgi:hypothetical protein